MPYYLDMENANFKTGDKIKENRMGAQVVRVLEVRENILYTTGGMYHVSKAIKA